MTRKPEPQSSRLTAARALIRCEQGGYSQLVLDSELRQAGLSGRDGAFACALFYGALERKLTLDHCIDAYAHGRIDDEVRAVLRIALYQLLYMDQLPVHAAVDEAVKSTRALRRSSAAGLVNGVLRAFLRHDRALPPIQGDSVRQLSLRYSCGREVVTRLLSWFGPDVTETILLSSLGSPPVFIRTNTLRTDDDTLMVRLAAEEMEVTRGPLVHCLVSSGDLAHTKAHAEGLFHIQDAASQQAALLLEPQPGQFLLDVCAAPGSKSFVLAQDMHNSGHITACDVNEGRLGLVSRGAARLGISIIGTAHQDATQPDPSLGLFDGVLCDVPCSGLGVLRRKPELKYCGADDIDALPLLQHKILEKSAHYCKVGGRLVYSTCTLNPAENEEIIGRFLIEHADFAPDPFDGGRHTSLNLPGQKGADGFFTARIRRLS